MLEVYRGNDLEYSHEKRQAKELIDLLNTYFNRYGNERQYIIIDPRVKDIPQIDAILYFRYHEKVNLTCPPSSYFL
ncbi:MAG: hypothetical protein ACYCSO_00005 [Cuniculiplasma sp.]